MAITVASWNIEGRLSPVSPDGRGSPQHIVDEIQRLDADVVFLPEATIDGQPHDGVDEKLKALGYSICEVSYDDSGTRPYDSDMRPTMRFLSRLTVVSFGMPRYGGVRTMLTLTVRDPDTQLPIRFFGIHLDDRSERNRMVQLRELADEIGKTREKVFLIGDFNAMQRNDIRARILKSQITKALIRYTTWGLIGYTLRRLCEMAEGGVLAELERRTELQSASKDYQATITSKSRDHPYYPSIPLVKIDHMYCDTSVTVENYTVHNDGGSDHRALSARLQLNKN